MTIDRRPSTVDRQQFWSFPWRLPQAGVAIGGVVAIGWLVQVVRPTLQLRLPGAPWNAVVVVVPLVLIALLYGWSCARKRTGVLEQLSRAPAAIVALLCLALAAAPIAIWPQGVAAPGWLAQIGLAHCLTALPFVLSLVAVLLVLVLVTVRRVVEREAGWARFLLLHAGLIWLLVAAAAGTGSLRQGRITLRIGDGPGVAAHSAEGVVHHLSVGLLLTHFRLDRFPPRLLVAGSDGAAAMSEHFLGDGATVIAGGVTATVQEWLPAAAVVEGVAWPYGSPEANPAAKVHLDLPGGDSVSGWIHAPSLVGGALTVTLPDGRIAGMELPRPRRFAATVRVVDADGVHEPVEVLVNRPLKAAGWWFYLLDYDTRLGAASDTVVLEAVEDRALPAVWLGLALVLLGALAHLVQARTLVGTWSSLGSPSCTRPAVPRSAHRPKAAECNSAIPEEACP